MTVNLNRSAARTRTPPKETAQTPARTTAPGHQGKPEATTSAGPPRDSFEQKVSTTVRAMVESARPGSPHKKDKKAPAASSATPDKASSTRDEAPVDRAADKRTRRRWKNLDAAVLQKSDTDCGEAALFTLKASKKHKSGFTSEALGWLRKKLQRSAEDINADSTFKDKVRIDLRDGTTPDELGALLGKQGMKVTGSVVDTRSRGLSDGLREGQMAVVLLDSNAVLPANKRQGGRGQLHWVTIAGMDDGGQPGGAPVRYRVKDPSHGEYWVSADQLDQAVKKARTEHGSGGALLVDQDNTQQWQALAVDNLKHTAALGNGNGVGSRRLSNLEAG